MQWLFALSGIKYSVLKMLDLFIILFSSQFVVFLDPKLQVALGYQVNSRYNKQFVGYLFAVQVIAFY